jgi:hypothetical protein
MHRPETKIEKDVEILCNKSSPEDGNRSSFLNVVFSSFLEYRTKDKVQNPSNSYCDLLFCGKNGRTSFHHQSQRLVRSHCPK